MQKVFIWNVNMQLTGRGMKGPVRSVGAGCGVREDDGKTMDHSGRRDSSTSRPSIFWMTCEQMMRGMSGDGGASLVAVATAEFSCAPV